MGLSSGRYYGSALACRTRDWWPAPAPLGWFCSPQANQVSWPAWRQRRPILFAADRILQVSKRRNEQGKQARLHRDGLTGQRMRGGGHQCCSPNNLTTFQSAFAVTPSADEGAGHTHTHKLSLSLSLSSPTFPDSPWSIRQTRVPSSANTASQSSKLQADRSLSKEPRGGAVNIPCLIACSMLPQLPSPIDVAAVASASTVAPPPNPTSVARLAADRTSVTCWPADLCLKQNQASRGYLGWTAAHGPTADGARPSGPNDRAQATEAVHSLCC